MKPKFPFDPYDKSDKEKARAILDATADVVLNYRPKDKQPKPRKRKKAKKPSGLRRNDS